MALKPKANSLADDEDKLAATELNAIWVLGAIEEDGAEDEVEEEAAQGLRCTRGRETASGVRPGWSKMANLFSRLGIASAGASGPERVL